MKIVPTQGPPSIPVTTGPSKSQLAAREAAIAKMVPPATPTEVVAERTRSLAALAEITSGTPAPVDYVEQAQQIQAQRQPIETTQEVSSPSSEIQDKSTETEATTSQPETKPDPSVSERYQLLARKERQLRIQQRQQLEALKTREAALAAKEEALKAKETEYQSGYISKQRLKDETLAALAEAELSYDDITQKFAERPQTDPATLAYIQRLEQKMARLESGIEETKKSYTDSQTQAYQAALKQIRTDVTNLVNSDPNFEAVKATKSVGDVVELIEKTYREDGILMSVEEACQEVEDYLVDESLKLARLNKIQSRLKPAVATPAPTQKQQAPQQQQPMKTLTNATGTTRQLSRRDRAILAMQGKLNEG